MCHDFTELCAARAVINGDATMSKPHVAIIPRVREPWPLFECHNMCKQVLLVCISEARFGPNLSTVAQRSTFFCHCSWLQSRLAAIRHPSNDYTPRPPHNPAGRIWCECNLVWILLFLLVSWPKHASTCQILNSMEHPQLCRICHSILPPPLVAHFPSTNRSTQASRAQKDGNCSSHFPSTSPLLKLRKKKTNNYTFSLEELLFEIFLRQYWDTWMLSPWYCETDNTLTSLSCTSALLLSCYLTETVSVATRCVSRGSRQKWTCQTPNHLLLYSPTNIHLIFITPTTHPILQTELIIDP